MEYAPEPLLQHMHSLVHVQYNLTRLARSLTEGAALAPWHKGYWSVLVFFAGIGAVLAGLSAAVFLAQTVVVCFCGRRGHPATASWPAYLFLALLLGVSAVLPFTVLNIHRDFSASSGTVDQGLALFANATALLGSGAATARTAESAGGDLKYAMRYDPMAPPSAQQAAANFTETFAALSGDLLGLQRRIPSLSNEHNVKDLTVTIAESYVFPALYGTTALFVIHPLFMLLFSVLRRPCMLGVGVALGSVLSVLIWLLMGIVFAAGLLGADTCTKPSEFLLAQMKTVPAAQYLTCSSPTASPFADALAAMEAGSMVLQAPDLVAHISSYCRGVKTTSVQHDCLTVLGGAKALPATIAQLQELLYCPLPHAMYNEFLTHTCNGVVYRFIWVLITLAVLGVVAALSVVFFIRFTAVAVPGRQSKRAPAGLALRPLNGRGRARGNDDDDDDDDDDEPLLDLGVGQSSYGGGGGGGGGPVPWGADPADRAYSQPRVDLGATRDHYDAGDAAENDDDALLDLTTAQPDFYSGSASTTSDNTPAWARAWTPQKFEQYSAPEPYLAPALGSQMSQALVDPELSSAAGGWTAGAMQPMCQACAGGSVTGTLKP